MLVLEVDMGLKLKHLIVIRFTSVPNHLFAVTAKTPAALTSYRQNHEVLCRN